MFSYKIISTIQTSDHVDKIDIGDEIYGPSTVADPEPGEFEFETAIAAEAAAQKLAFGSSFSLTFHCLGMLRALTSLQPLNTLTFLRHF